MGDRVAVIKDGHLQQVDSPQRLYERPVNAFVGAFIGSPSMNLFEAELVVDEASASIVLGSHRLALPADALLRRPALREFDRARLIVGIRPEDFEDASLVSDAAEGRRVGATAWLVEALGSEMMVHFEIDARRVDSGDPDAVNESTGSANAVGRVSPRSTVKPRSRVEFVVATENLHFFDLDTRRAIWD